MLKRIRLTLNVKLAIVLFSFIFIPMVILGTFWYQRSLNIIIENVVRSNTQTLEQLTDRLDSYVLELERRTLPVLNSTLVNEFLKIDVLEPYDEYILKKRMNKEVLLNFIFDRSDILNVSVVSETGRIVSPVSEIVGFEGYEMYINLLKHPDSYGAKGKMFIIGTRWVDNAPILTVIRRILDTDTYETNGLLIIDINYRNLYQILEKIQLGETGFFMVVDAGGTIIYHPKQEKWGQKTGKLSADIYNNESTGYIIAPISDSDNRQEIIIYDHSYETGWTLVASVPLRESIAGLVTLLYISIAVALFLIVTALASTGFFTLSLTRSLSLLQKLMKKTEKGDFSIRAPKHKNDEIGDLYGNFNMMVAEIQRLAEVVHLAELREKEMQIKQIQSDMAALQSQINPHFLYNTLEVVNSYAIEAEAESISSMITAIAKIFRYNAGGQHDLVPMKEELDHITLYLQFQKERFKNLQVEMVIGGDIIKQVKTVRFVLQPIVENAFTHGYQEHGLPPGFIAVAGFVIDGKYCIRVSDKGRGMSPDTMDEYNTLFAGVAEKQLIQENHYHKRDALGLWNVHSRIRLTFGDGYGLHISKSDSEGTEIEILLPLGG